jgi:outer membrane receptor protein involved in Fe transport
MTLREDCRAILLGCATIASPFLCAYPSLLHAQEQVQAFDIPSQELDSALRAFARASLQQIVFEGNTVKGRRSVALKGEYTIHDALDRLLQGSGLRVRRGESGLLIVGDAEHSAENEPALALEEVVVTAQKRSENLQNVPLSVSTIGGEALKTYGETHLTDYAASIPGLAVESAYGVPGSVTVSIRGISTADADNTPTVATYIDDVPVSSSGGNGFGNLIGTDLFTYDVDHVEVLKGPQGTLYGASSLGGLLKYVTRTPDLNRSSLHVGGSTVAIERSSQLGWGVNGAASVPIVPGELALSISAAHVFTPGYIDNVAKNDEDFNHGVQDGARLALFWQPIDRLSIKLSALYDRSDYDGLGLIQADPATQKPIYGYLSTAAVEAEGQSARTTLLAANLSYDFGGANLTSVTGYSQAAATFKVDASLIFEPIFGVQVPFVNHYDFDKFTQEVRLSSTESNSFHWLLGGFYTREDSSRQLGALALSPTGEPDVALSPLIESDFQNTFEEVAVFGNATYDLTSLWSVSAGARYSRNEQTFSGSTSGALSGLPTYYPPASGHKVTYSVSSQYHLTADAMAYARVATGYRPGGDNGETPGAEVPPTYGPDTTINYEVGVKSELLARRLLVNTSVFYIDWKNIQLEVIGPLESFYYSNAAQASSKGVELSSSYVAAAGLQFGLNATFTDATLGSDAFAVGGAKGDRLPASARWAGAFNADYTHALFGNYQGRLGLVWRYVGDRNVTFPASSDYQRLAAYDTVSASAGVSNERWDFNLYVRNVANERTYISWGGALGPVILQPRTIGLNVSATF